MKRSTAGHCTAQTGSFACLFDCSLLARPLRFGPQRVGSPCSVVSLAQSTPLYLPNRIIQELCESRGGRHGLSVLTSLLVSVDVKIYWTMLRHWSQLVPNMSTDIWGHYASFHHHHHPKPTRRTPPPSTTNYPNVTRSARAHCTANVKLGWVGWVLLYVQRNSRLIRDGSPGRPPRLSHICWALKQNLEAEWQHY